MLGRKNRFHGHASLRFVYQNNKVARGPMMSLKYCSNPRRQEYRLAVVVSKKVIKSAVARNRMRRRIYEQVRLLAPQITEPYDMVITVFNDQLLGLEPDKLSEMVRAQLKQAGIINSRKSNPS